MQCTDWHDLARHPSFWLKSLDGPGVALLSDGEGLGEAEAERFIYSLLKVHIEGYHRYIQKVLFTSQLI